MKRLDIFSLNGEHGLIVGIKDEPPFEVVIDPDVVPEGDPAEDISDDPGAEPDALEDSSSENADVPAEKVDETPEESPSDAQSDEADDSSVDEAGDEAEGEDEASAPEPIVIARPYPMRPVAMGVYSQVFPDAVQASVGDVFQGGPRPDLSYDLSAIKARVKQWVLEPFEATVKTLLGNPSDMVEHVWAEKERVAQVYLALSTSPAAKQASETVLLHGMSQQEVAALDGQTDAEKAAVIAQGVIEAATVNRVLLMTADAARRDANDLIDQAGDYITLIAYIDQIRAGIAVRIQAFLAAQGGGDVPEPEPEPEPEPQPEPETPSEDDPEMDPTDITAGES